MACSGYVADCGTPRALHGMPRGLCGTPRRLCGIPRALHGMSRRLRGTPRVFHGMSRRLRGTSRALRGRPRNLRGSERERTSLLFIDKNRTFALPVAGVPGVALASTVSQIAACVLFALRIRSKKDACFFLRHPLPFHKRLSRHPFCPQVRASPITLPRQALWR
jgi:hypothetical protein